MLIAELMGTVENGTLKLDEALPTVRRLEVESQGQRDSAHQTGMVIL